MGDKERHFRQFHEDGKMKAMNYLALFGWLIFIVALVLFFLGVMPASDNFYRDSGARVGESGRKTMMLYSVLTFTALLLISGWGFVINLSRMGRKTDRFHVSFLIHSLLSIGAIIYYIAAR